MERVSVQEFKNDLIAGFNVFLLALPLCLGIAVASNCPPVSGIIAAIVGGMAASWFGGTRLSIKGPAAGLIVIVLGAVSELGGGDPLLGYKRALAVGVIAAILQIGIAWARKATIAEMIPPSVIHGMLAAIGIIIVSKQAYILMGVPPSGSKPLTLLAHLPSALPHLNVLLFSLGLMAFVLTFVWPLFKKISHIPSSIVILSCVIPLSLYFKIGVPHVDTFMGYTYEVGPKDLINLPDHFLEGLSFPDFSNIWSGTSLKYILMFTLVGSIESLLTVCAVDCMAPQVAPSDLNKDLRAVGIGNLISALIGGLPMISEIVRSKANIDYGATSAGSNFFHGLFMLIAVVLLPEVLHLIPLSVLAAFLIYVGLKLASPQAFIHAYRVGIDQFILFVTTCVVTLVTDLLTGIGVGMALKLALHLIRRNKLKELFNPTITFKKFKNHIEIKIEGPLTFVSYLKVKKRIMDASKQTGSLLI